MSNKDMPLKSGLGGYSRSLKMASFDKGTW